MFVQLHIVKIMVTQKLNFVVSALFLHFILCGKYFAVNACYFETTAESSMYSIIKNYYNANETILVIRHTVNGHCPSPWTKLSNRRWYLLAEDKRLTFSDAKSYCKAHGGYIVDVSSESEYITLSIKLGKCSNMILHHVMVHYISQKRNT